MKKMNLMLLGFIITASIMIGIVSCVNPVGDSDNNTKKKDKKSRVNKTTNNSMNNTTGCKYDITTEKGLMALINDEEECNRIIKELDKNSKGTKTMNQTAAADSLLGDVNNDFEVNINDALIVAFYTAGLKLSSFTNISAADVDRDGRITINDSLLIAKYSSGLINDLLIKGDIRLTDNGLQDEVSALKVYMINNEYKIFRVQRNLADKSRSFELFLTTLDLSGNKKSDIKIFTDEKKSFGNSIWNGTDFGHFWMDNKVGDSKIYFTRFNSTGTEIENNVTITTRYSMLNSVVWNGSEYAVAWTEFNQTEYYELYFARISPTGIIIQNNIKIPDISRKSSGASLAWNGYEYGVAWADFGDMNNEVIYFTRFSSAGIKIGDDVKIYQTKNGLATPPKLKWSGKGFNIIWSESTGNSRSIYFASIDSDGTKIGDNVKIADSRKPSLFDITWTGTEYGLVWDDDRDENAEIYFAKISSDGKKIEDDRRITNDPGSSTNPSILFTGTEYAVVWIDYRTRIQGTNKHEIQDVYFALLNNNGIKK